MYLISQISRNVRSRFPAPLKNIGRFRLMCTKTTKAETADLSTKGRGNLNDIRVSGIQRAFLVFAGKYKSLSDVPEYISASTLSKARSMARIKLNLSIVGVLVVVCIIVAIIGKREAEKGVTVTTINKDFHRKYNEEKDKEQGIVKS